MAQPDRLQSQATDNRSAQADAALAKSNAQEFVKAEPEPEPEPVLQQGALSFDTFFDLETGNTFRSLNAFIPDEFDFEFALDGRSGTNFLFQNQVAGVVIAFLDEQPLSSISTDDLESAIFTDQLVNMPAENDDTILLRTSEGNVFALGNFNSVEQLNVTFDFLLLM